MVRDRAELLQKSTAAVPPTEPSAGCWRTTPGLSLLLIDEFGFDRLEQKARPRRATSTTAYYDARTGRRSTALATNIDFAAWADYLGDPPLATAFLDRLVDGAVILKLTGRSYRAHRAAARRNRTRPTGHDRTFDAVIPSPLRRPLPTSHPAECGHHEPASLTPSSPHEQMAHAATGELVPTGPKKLCPS